MLEDCRPKFRFVQVQPVDQNELHQVVHVFEPAQGFAVLERVTLQSDQMKQSNHSHARAFNLRLDGSLFQPSENIFGDKHEIHLHARLVGRIKLEKRVCGVFN